MSLISAILQHLISGGFVGLLLGQTTVLGIDGWRVAFHLVAAISIAVGILNWFLADDPHFARDDDGKQAATAREVVAKMIEEAKFVVRIPTFQIFVAQGVSGSFPWSALSFASMWLELKGCSHSDTAVLMTIFWVASSIGGLLRGKMGDLLPLRYPDASRIVLSQISPLTAVPLAAVLLLGLPDDPSKGVSYYGAVLFIMGIFMSWNSSATNFPIFVEIVPREIKNKHLRPGQILRAERQGESVEQDRGNAASLAKALYTSIAIPFVVCAAIYSFLYCSYPRDRDRARMQAFVESELRQMEEQGTSCLEDGNGHRDDGQRAGVTCDSKELREAEMDTVRLLADHDHREMQE